MQINIKIHCDNASLNDGSETVSDILKKLADKLEDRELDSIEATTVYDLNGNKVLWLTVERD